MWFFLIYIQLPAVQLQSRIALRGSQSPCEGRLEVYHEGQWGLVCHHYWEDVNGMVVCRSLDCGDHVKSGILSRTNLKSQPETFWMDEVQCTGKEEWLWDCPFNGWKIARCLSHNFVSVVCSGKISLSLNLNGLTNECAGLVQFATHTRVIDVCDQNWSDSVANMACKELDCGTYQKHTSIASTATGSSYVHLQCTGNEDFLWQCVDRASAKSCNDKISIICSEHNLVRLRGGPDVCEGFLEKEDTNVGKWVNVKCKELASNMVDSMCAKLKCGTAVSVKPCDESENTWVKCSDRVKIELGKSMRTPSPCYGEVYINVNGSHHAVCSNNTTFYTKIGEVVCRELQCGTPLSVLQGSIRQGQISLADCHGQERSLWECMHKHGEVGSCQTVNILCSGSLDMRLSNGLDKCAGQLEVNFFGSWKTLVSKHWSKTNSDMVCQHLECGGSMDSSPHRFVRSKLPLLNGKLECRGSSISQCTMEEEQNIPDYSAISILCNKHKLWFLEGSSACEGKVKGDPGGYLHNITIQTADDVCKRNLCGGLRILASDNGNMKSTFNCSTFNCSMENSTALTSAELQEAYVKCSGSMEVRLQNKCHGKVLMCSSDSCGVCMDTWTEAQSDMLCKSLGCGQTIKETYRGKETPGVTVASVHCSQAAENFSQCNFVPIKSTSLCKKPAYVACTGSVNAVLQDARDRCAGIPKLFYSGALYPLCTNSMDKKTQNVICAKFGCGKALSFNEAISSIAGSQGLTQIACPDSNVSSCDFSKTTIQTCATGHLKCTDWRRLVLINPKDACKGEVYVQNETHLSAVSNASWNDEERNELCKYLECGEVSEMAAGVQMDMPFWSRSFSCPEKPNSIWDCETEMKPVKNPHQLYISCAEEPKPALRGTCTGEVRLNTERVCHKSEKTGGVYNEFCLQQGCSMLFRTWPTEYDSNARLLSCTGNESKLWQCNAGTSQCRAVVSLACAKALRWRFSSPCGGKLQVSYGGQWEPVCPLQNKEDADRICRGLKCGNANTYMHESLGKARTDIRMKCTDDHNKLMHCFKSGPEVCTQRAVIYCDNYKLMESAPLSGLIMWVVVGVVLLVVVLIIFWKRKTILTVFRSPKGRDAEISDYDDVVATVSPMEDCDNVSEYDREAGGTGPGSSGTEYDDVVDRNIKQAAHRSFTNPLLPPRPNDLLEKVTFKAEVELQEDYDDVMLLQAVASEPKESLDALGPASELLLLGSDEAKPQEDE